MLIAISIIILIILCATLFYQRARLLTWTLILAILLLIFTFTVYAPISQTVLWIIWAVIFLPLNIKPLRRVLLTKTLFAAYRKVMPAMSRTEKEALEAGTVWWEGELFSGRPNWKKLLAYPEAKLTLEEQAFLDGPTEELCRLNNDWQVVHETKDLSPEVWQFIKEKKFMGLAIPKEYNGLGFSPYMFGRVSEKLFSAGITLATTVGVPNSLGPAELLLHYGTEEQKNYYLPRLAVGQEIPCFALTGPEAGSDAGAMPDHGIVCRGMHEGKEVLGLRLTFNKRYITLAPVATVLGMAFKMFDPDHLLGTEEDLGITCALIPRNTPGIQIGRRHYPANNPFQNGPIQGENVFIPLDFIIGGQKMAGQGWRMLMECLAAGRAVCLPSSGVSAAKVASITTGAYARVRKQFGISIGRFEGIEEVLTRIAGKTYWNEAVFKFTLGALNSGAKPPVASAIVKYHATEVSRQIVNDAMDVQGGKAVVLGPRNYLASGYQGIPVGITVEGANILTRSMIIFGQGAVRCHPYVLEEMRAAQESNLVRFDTVLFRHIGFTCSNIFRALWLGLTSAHWTRTPVKGVTRRYYQHATRFSAAFALCADFAMLTLGGDLKRKEKLSARLGDVLSQLYILSAVLKRFAEDGSPAEDLPLLHWAARDCLYQTQNQLDSLLRNFPNKVVAKLLRLLVFPLGKRFAAPRDKLGRQVADLLLTPSATFDRLVNGIYRPTDLQSERGILHHAFQHSIEIEPLEKVVEIAYKKGRIKGFAIEERIAAAQKVGIITTNEAEKLVEYNKLRLHVINVDDFDSDLK